MRLKKTYKKIIPLCFRDFLSQFFFNFFLLYSPIRYFFILKKLKHKKKINVILLMYNVDSWKLHSLYEALDKHSGFNPVVVICPIITKGIDFMQEKLAKSLSFCEVNTYNFYVAYDFDKSLVIDIRKKFICDVVVFTNPNQLSGELLYIDNFDDCLTCYIPYSFRIDCLYNYEYNNRTANKVWKCFYETELHKKLAVKYAANKGRNVVVSGFPYLDVYKNKCDYISNQTRKIIIWAPHWTLPGAQDTGLDWSCFLDYYEVVLVLAEKYKDEICFVMKPHPFLFDTLSKDSVWGKKRVKSYLDRWEALENCRVETGDYTQLFVNSDALIHDSGSFMTEYLLQDKPMAYTVNNIDGLNNRFNEWGNVVLGAHELIFNASQLESFVNNLILLSDNKKEIRNRVLEENNLIDNKLISVGIVDELYSNIC